jgi:hypothetical protein
MILATIVGKNFTAETQRRRGRENEKSNTMRRAQRRQRKQAMPGMVMVGEGTG